MDLRKVILRYLDGRVTRAYAPLFEEGSDPIPAADMEGMPLFVSLRDLKAVFFVRTFTGNPAYDSPKTPGELPSRGTGRLVWLRFADGEKMLGDVQPKTDLSRGFYLTVLDPEDNNLLVYVNPSCLAEPPRTPEEPAG